MVYGKIRYDYGETEVKKMTDINATKYENAILFLISKMSDNKIHGRKKLAKLLYYVDFDRFEYQESMQTVTGDEYKHRPMGPVPDSFLQVVTNMEKDGKLTVDEIDEYGLPHKTSVYTALTDPDMSVFDADDIAILNRVARHYADKSGGDLERQSHGEAPWRGVKENEHIPFELAFYRETDFSDAE